MAEKILECFLVTPVIIMSVVLQCQQALSQILGSSWSRNNFPPFLGPAQRTCASFSTATAPLHPRAHEWESVTSAKLGL